MRLTEIFSDQLAYDMWGWIQADGKVKMATPAQAESPRHYYHPDLARELGKDGYTEAFASGWARWFLKDGELRIEIPEFDYDMLTTLDKGIKKIEELVKNPKNFRHFVGRMAIQQSQENAPMAILRYYLETTREYKNYRSNSRRGLLARLEDALEWDMDNEDY
jgi:hypothetical protein